MRNDHNLELWLERFPAFQSMTERELQLARGTVMFPVLEPGDVAYRVESECPNYVMCIDGLTRVFKNSAEGRELLIYKVSSGGTCVLTTQCLFSNTNFPAESTALERTLLAAIPKDTFHHLLNSSQEFRTFVLDDYAKLLGQMFTLVEDIAFSTTHGRLAQRLIAEAGPQDIVVKTHQQLASDVGSVREVVSRYLSEWEKAGWVENGRGQVRILNRPALAGLK